MGRIHCPSGCDDDYVHIDSVNRGETYYTCYKCEWTAYYDYMHNLLLTVSEPINNAPLVRSLNRLHGYNNMYVDEGDEEG